MRISKRHWLKQDDGRSIFLDFKKWCKKRIHPEPDPLRNVN